MSRVTTLGQSQIPGLMSTIDVPNRTENGLRNYNIMPKMEPKAIVWESPYVKVKSFTIES
jgi:hypothetical protein